jgi:pimeloyl-ACP methyl ester carboxylesterase
VCRLNRPGVVQTLVDLKARLATAPVQGPNGLLLTAASAGTALAPALSLEAQWPLIVDALADAQAGNHALMFALLGAARGSSAPAGMRAFGAQQLIQCNDYGTRRPAAEVLPFSAAIDGVSAHVAGSFGVIGDSAGCAAWPEADLPIIRNLKGNRIPVLLLGSQFDPNTPLSWTRSLAAALGAERHIVRYQGGGHTTYATRGNTCIDQVGDAFVFDLKRPEEGFSCAARPVIFRPAAAAATGADEAARRVQQLRSQRDGFAPQPQ